MIVSLIDISEVRRAERQREQTLRFLSHDTCARRRPPSRLLLELQADAAKALPQPALLARIGGLARRTLDLADDFIRLARAETQPLRLLESDLPAWYSTPPMRCGRRPAHAASSWRWISARRLA